MYIRYMLCKPYSTKETNFIIENYPKYGVEYCIKQTGRTRSAIFSKVSKLGLKYHTSFIDLKKILSPVGYYLLGFLWADGNLKKDSPIVRCSIVEKDGDVLKDIFNQVGLWKIKIKPASIKNGVSRQSQVNFYVYDFYFYNFLKDNDFGLKSIRSPSKILNIIPTNFHYLFWRGYFDGDGCFYEGLSNSANVSGPIEQDWTDFLKCLDEIDVDYDFALYDRGSGKSSRVTMTNYEEIMKFGNYIYQNEFYGLIRKLDKFKLIVDKADKYTNLKNNIKYNSLTDKFEVSCQHGEKRYRKVFCEYQDSVKAVEVFLKEVDSYKLKIRELVKTSKKVFEGHKTANSTLLNADKSLPPE